MSKTVLNAISILCLASMIGGVILILICLFNFSWFELVIQENIDVPIQWHTVERWQWYSLWGLTTAFLLFGLCGVYYLFLSVRGISAAGLFDLKNSVYLRRFALIALSQVILKPMCFTLAIILLSWNHPAGQKMLVISVGSEQVSTLVLGLIIWVMSDMLVAGNELDVENKHFI